MRISHIVCIVLVWLTASNTASVRGQQITSVAGTDDLPQGTIGTVLTIRGDGFGQHKPKVTLTDPSGGKSYSLHVLSHTPFEVCARIDKAVAGDLQLAVDPKGKTTAAIVAPQPVTVREPNVLNGNVLDPPVPFLVATIPGATVDLHGEFFGTKKPHARIGGVKAKVQAFSDTIVHVIVPKHAPAGSQLIELSNAIGTSTREILVIPLKGVPEAADPAHVQLVCAVEGIAVSLDVTSASVGTTVSQLAGTAVTWIEVRAKSPDGVHHLGCRLLLNAGSARPPFTLAAPFDDPASAHVDFSLSGAVTKSSPPPGLFYTPAEPFAFEVSQLDPVLHTAHVVFGGTMDKTQFTQTEVLGDGSFTIAP